MLWTDQEGKGSPQLVASSRWKAGPMLALNSPPRPEHSLERHDVGHPIIISMTRPTKRRGAEESTKEAKRPRREQKAPRQTKEQSKTLKGTTKAGQEPVRQTRASSKPLAPLDEEPERLLRRGRATKQQGSRQAQPKQQEPASRSSGGEDVAAAAAKAGAGGGAMERRQGSSGQPGNEVSGSTARCGTSEALGACCMQH